jgi:hypothetical protein
MSESKELLEATIKGLQEKVNELNNDLDAKKKELEDVNKPEMTDEMYDEIRSLIENGVDQVSIDDDDLEFGIDVDYDRKINLHDFSLNDSYAFTRAIMDEIDSYYKIVTKE